MARLSTAIWSINRRCTYRLVVAGSGVTAGVNDTPVSTRRVFHTILDFAGLASEHSLRRAGRRGRPRRRHEAVSRVWLAAAGHGGRGRRARPSSRARSRPTISIATRAKASDLGSGVNLSSTLRARLEEYPVPSPEAARAPDTLDDEAKRRLASLGYVSAGAAPIVRRDAPRPADMTALFGDLERASALFTSGDYTAAIPVLTRILAADPNNLDATLRLATAHSLAWPRCAGRRVLQEGRSLGAALLRREDIPRAPLCARQGLGARCAAPGAGRRGVAGTSAGTRSAGGRSRAAGARGRCGGPASADLPPAHADGRRAGATRTAGDERRPDAAGHRGVRGGPRKVPAAFTHDLQLGVLYLAARRLPDAAAALDRVPASSPEFPMALFKRAQASVLLGEPDQKARIDAARRHADGTTRPLIERERLFEGK